MLCMNNFLYRVKTSLFFFLFLCSLLTSRLNAAILRDSLVLPQPGQLTLFGFHLFSENNLPDPASSHNLPSADYRLALNDKISIQIMGRSQANFIFSIDEKGFISPDQMPGIFLSGLTFLQAKKILSAHFSRFYTFTSGQFIVSLVPSGKIRVYVLGNVQKEGFYELPAMANIFQAIAAAGGPTNSASIRNIKMIQQGKASNLDVYAFSSYPNGEIPKQLHDLDIIHLPVSKTVISLTGAIHRPLKYEVLDGECLSDVIPFGGGLLASANVQYAKLFRYTENLQLQIDLYLPPYLAGKSCFTFQPGDSLVFKEINELSQNRVKISGAVLFPGFYGLDSSKTVLSLFKKAILSEGASKDQFILLRKDENGALGIKKMSLKASDGFVDVELRAGDEVIIDFKSKFKEEFTIEVAGNVKVPFVRSFPPGKQLHVSEAIFLAGGLASGASGKAYIFRTNPNTPQQTIYLPLDINSMLDNPLSVSDVWLETGDKLFVPDKTYLDFPTQIGLFGAVKFPQEFTFDPSLKLQDLFRLSGGITDGADISNVEVFRTINKDKIPTLSKIIIPLSDSFSFKDETSAFKLMPGDKLMVRSKKNLAATKTVFLSGNIHRYGNHFSDKQPYFLSDLIVDAGGITIHSSMLHGKLIRNTKGRFEQPFNLQSALNYPHDVNYDPILKHNDSVYLEEINNTIFLEVPDYKQFGMDTSMQFIPIAFKGNYGVKWYLDQFGGPILTSKINGTVTISRLTGELLSATLKDLSKNELKVMSGDIIKVSAENRPDSRVRNQIDWGKITDRILGITTTLSLFLVYLNR